MTAAALGWGMDGFDFYLSVYALPGIIAAFALSKAAAGLLATQTLTASALGGIAMGALADRIGRRRALVLSIGWYALFTALCGLAQNYAQLAALRALEGFGFGGEWAVGAVLAAEWSSPSRRGRNLGFMQSAWAIGWLAANAAFQIVVATVPPGLQWRALFALGILPALAILSIRRRVEEPPVRRTPMRPSALFRGPLARATALATLLAIGAQSGYYALFTWLPSYLTTERHLPPLAAGATLYALIGGAFAGYVSAGMLNDALGRRRTFVLFSLCCAATAPVYLLAVRSTWELLPAGAVLGYVSSGIFSGFGPLLSELFPSGLRATAQGFCYNVGRGTAGAAPYLVGALAARTPIAVAMVAVALCAYALAAVAALALPETKGRSLEAPSVLDSCP